MFYEIDNTPVAIDPKDPTVWILMILIIACIIGWAKIQRDREQLAAINEKYAEEVVQTMFQHFWNGTADDEFYALTQTKVALDGHPEPLVAQIIRNRLRDWHHRNRSNTTNRPIEQKMDVQRPKI